MTIIEFPIRRVNVVTGIVLIVLPLLALGVKFIVPGVMMMFVQYGGILLAGVYVLWTAMVASGFFGRRAAFSFIDDRRARVAGWVHGVSLVLVPFFLTDGTDAAWTSPFMKLFGVNASDTSDALAAGALTIAIGSYVWFFIEWVIAVRVKRRVV